MKSEEEKEGKKRLGPTLKFDPVKEKDILNAIEVLSSGKKLGDLVSHLLRLAFESPEVYGNGQEVRQLVDKMMEYGMSPTRYNFFNQVSKEMETIKKKVDTIYDMTYKMYTLAQMGKFLGLEEKADNSFRATFLLERQITEICTALGVYNMNHSFLSNKLEDTHQRAETVLEYIIESYDNIVNELKSSMTLQVTDVRQIINQLPADNLQNNQTGISENIGDNIYNTLKNDEDIDDDFVDLPERQKKPKEADKPADEPKEYRVLTPAGESANALDLFSDEEG